MISCTPKLLELGPDLLYPLPEASYKKEKKKKRDSRSLSKEVELEA